MQAMKGSTNIVVPGRNLCTHELRQLAVSAGIPAHATSVEQEPEGVNLFLRIRLDSEV